jgi:hypothetical protein
MKPYSATNRRNVAVTIAVLAFVALFGVVMAGTPLAQDTSKDVTSWDTLDRVLELPPVFRLDRAANAESEPTDTCTEDCSSSSDPGDGQSSAAVAGMADNPANVRAGTADSPTDKSAADDGSTLQESFSQRQTAATGDDLEGPDNFDGSIGSAQDYEAQAAAEELGTSGMVQVPTMIIGAPIGPYYLLSPAWMRQPSARIAPLPSIVPHGFRRPMAAFPRGGFGGFRGGFSGFHGGFGRR